MMLTVYFLRHGQTQWNAENNRYCGRTDIPLTDLGRQQAEAVGRLLKDVPFEGIYSSPLQRAYQTAGLAGGGREVTVDQRLIEADFGKWEGKTKEQFLAEIPNTWPAWLQDPMTTQAGGTGETGKEIIERMDGFFQSMLANHLSGNILVTAHNGINRLYMAYKLGMNVKHYRRLHMDNCSVTIFQLDQDGEFVLLQLNAQR
ncbi:MAG TPA: histidine phosphatase family protein [Flavisolibacter sp.]|nr:histidine phosphatase family protein [Flavisolibacter sp.]